MRTCWADAGGAAVKPRERMREPPTELAIELSLFFSASIAIVRSFIWVRGKRGISECMRESAPPRTGTDARAHGSDGDGCLFCHGTLYDRAKEAAQQALPLRLYVRTMAC